MPSSGWPASSPLAAALHGVLPALESTGAAYALLGGIAAAAWGRVRPTMDLDFSLGLPPAARELDGLLDALDAAGFRVQRDGIRSRLARGIHIVTVYLDRVRVDLFLQRPDSFWAASLENRKLLDVMGLRLPVIALEDLIAYKLVSERAIDREDARMLALVNRDVLDTRMLGRTLAELAGKLGRPELSARLSEILPPGLVP